MLFLISCNDQKKEHPPTKSETINYLSNNLSNGSKVTGYSYMERSVSFRVNGERVEYRTEFIHPEDNVHWELTQKFSLGDISYVSEDNTNSIKGITLNLKNKSNHRTRKSLNGNPVHSDIPTDEMIVSVFVTIEPSKFEGTKKAFENLLKVEREQNAADYFEN